MKPKLLTLAALVFAASTAIAQTGATAGASGPGSSSGGANTGATAGAAGGAATGGAATGGGATMTPGAGGAAAGGAGAAAGGPGAASGSTMGAAPNPGAAARQLDETMMPGWSTMTASERSEMQRQMAGFTTYAECTAFMSKHRERMQARSGQASTATAGTPARDACDHLPRR